jgi:hypothetical protein
LKARVAGFRISMGSIRFHGHFLSLQWIFDYTITGFVRKMIP